MKRSYSLYNERQLLELLAQSEEKAFEEIYRRYWKQMIAMATLRLKRCDIAEDIVQDVFTSLWKRRCEINIQSLESWLAAAVKFKIITLVNRRLKKELSIEETPEISFSDATIETHMLEHMIATEINRLPEKCRVVFQFSRDLGYSNREIARQLDISEKTVEMHITSARRKLTLRLQEILQSLFSFL